MKKNSGYKPSGIEWIGDVPETWKNLRISRSFRSVSSGSTPSTNNRLYYENGSIPWLQTGDLNDSVIDETSKKITPMALEECSLRLYPKGAVAIAMYGATIGKLGILNIEACTNQACCVLSNSQSLDGQFTFYWLLGNRPAILSFSAGGGQPNISQETIKSLIVPAPELNEQKAIAVFLSKKLKEIAFLIDNKKSLIDQLSTYRIAVITEAVTKGINKSVKMKPCSLPWINEIPKHWTVTRIGREATVKARLGWKGLKASEYVEEGFALLSTPDIKGREIDFINVNNISEERYLESPEIMLKQGDVLLAKDGSTLGIVNVVRTLPRPATVNSSIAVIRTSKNLESEYLFYLLQSNYFLNLIQQYKGGMGVPHLFQWDINRFGILLPDVAEQKAIAEFLDQRIRKIDDCIEMQERQIEQLNEYKMALIAETVTGKVDLREIANHTDL